MKPSDRTEFVEIVLGFAELKGKQLSAPALELYWRSLQHWPLPAFKAAAEQLVRTSEFMPGPKEFEDLRKAGRPTAGEAWGRVLQHVRDSAWRKGPLGDPLIDKVVSCLGGYGAIALCELDKAHFLERRFAEHYEAIQDAEDVRNALPQIAGPSHLPQLTAVAKRLTVA